MTWMLLQVVSVGDRMPSLLLDALTVCCSCGHAVLGSGMGALVTGRSRDMDAILLRRTPHPVRVV